MGPGLAMEVFIICQLEKELFSSRKDEIPQLHYLLQEYSNRKRLNQGRT